MLELGPVLFGGDEKIYWLSEAKKKLLASTMDCSRHWKKSSVATKAIHTSKYAKAVSSQYPSTRVILNATDIYIYIYIYNSLNYQNYNRWHFQIIKMTILSRLSGHFSWWSYYFCFLTLSRLYLWQSNYQEKRYFRTGRFCHGFLHRRGLNT